MDEEGQACAQNVRIGDGGWRYGPKFRECGKPLKTDEQRERKLCGNHLGAAKRGERATQRQNEQEAAKQAGLAEAEEVCAGLKTLGIFAHPNHLPLGWVTLPLNEAQDVLARLRGEGR